MEFEGARGLNTCTSKKALSFREPQKPSAATSKRAPSELTVEAGRFCPDTGFNVGSVLETFGFVYCELEKACLDPSC